MRSFYFLKMDNSQQALAQLQQAQQASQNPQDLLANQQQQLGVSGQRDTVSGLRGAITNTTKLLQQVAPSVMGRTQGSLVTNAQATRQIGNEQAPIAQNLNNQNQSYGLASQDLSDLENRAQQAASAAYTGQQDRLGYLQNLYNNYFQREQAESARQSAEADRQEQVRQFNEQLAASKASSAQSNSGLGSGITDIINSIMNPTKKYVGNDDFRGRLSYEAQNGNNNAGVALKYAGNDGKYSGPVANQDELNALKAIGVVGNYYVKK